MIWMVLAMSVFIWFVAFFFIGEDSTVSITHCAVFATIVSLIPWVAYGITLLLPR